MSLEGDREADPARWYTTNLVGVPAPLLASTAFNAHPQPLHIAGARECNPGLFALLQRSRDADEARAVFAHYMSLAFGLVRPSDEERGEPPPDRRRWRSSYLKLLQGWGLDSNGPSGAVLKGWVESRFGLVPSFHGAPLARFPSPAWVAYLEQKGASRYHNNSIFQQLDLLYEFCQWMLARFALLGSGTHATLWRGSTRCEEQIAAGSLRERHCTVRLNNLVSFSTTRDAAQCFGDWVLEARIPQCKLLLVPGLLNTTSLHGEAEVLAIGGDCEVEARYD
ncbi:NAD(+)--dinitrogen-reductase ADP-D-ribosyltransferase [Rhizobacter sp. AJA081-3]|uniref:NAD(+)--dinitrogen-reductase ADP-D-ribosyltransferase n=1 Tax=Rhizobacter sp. AJA081-3 TaxID=2753607 RepID=UPI001ADFD6F8|nr:NAD(+)--dinitrogen-reductase ADP-D-ribosyltransferase [Rhizobacter sp. AJA081-3]